MLDRTFQLLEHTFAQLSFGRLVFLVSVLLLFLYVYDNSTGYGFYSRIEKRISALERLYALKQSHVDSTEGLSRVYASIVNELNERPSVSPINWSYEPIFKFLAAAFLPIIFVIIGLVKLLIRQEDGPSIFGGAVIITALLGIPAVLIPTWSSLWLNIIVYSTVQIILMVVLSKYGNKKTDQSNSTPAANGA
jgi:hypothetical protein